MAFGHGRRAVGQIAMRWRGAGQRAMAATAVLVLHGAILVGLLAPLTREIPPSDTQAATPFLIVSLQMAVTDPVASAVPAPLLEDIPAPALSIALPTLPPLATEPLVTDAFEAAREVESSVDAAEVERLQGVYVGQIRGRLTRVLEMVAIDVPHESGPCEVQVIQNERGDVLDVDTGACTGSAARKSQLAIAMRRASPLPMPPAGLAPGSSLTLDLSDY